MEFGRVSNLTIKIEPTHNMGFYVRVGCGRFAFTNKEDLKLAFMEWCDNPEKLEKAYNEMGPSDETTEEAEAPNPNPRSRLAKAETETSGDPSERTDRKQA